MAGPLRFLFVGQFTAQPSGERVTVSGERMADVMARLKLRTAVVVADRLGNAGQRTYELQLGSARALRVADVIADHQPLAALAEIATALVRPGNAISIDDAIARVEQVVGAGPLSRALAALQQPPTPASTTAAPSTAQAAPAPAAPAAVADGIDGIFAQADVPQGDDVVRAAKTGLDAFIGAMRGGREKAPASRSDEQRRRASSLVSDAVEATAADLLSQDPVAALEANWRGLKLVLGESPGHSRLAVELLDASGDAIADALSRVLDGELVPDAIFVTEAFADPATMASLAARGADASVPIIVTLDPEALEAGELPMQAWSELRRTTAAAWLCAATNDLVATYEATRVGPRVAFAAPVFALAAMLAASLRRDGTFGDAFGRAGAIASPASRPLGDRRAGTRNIPTRAEMTPEPMRQMADVGVVVLGSEPGGERLIAIGAPMVASADGPTLAGRILVGRAVRAAISARDGVSHGAGDDELAPELARAAATILPDGPPGTCVLRGRSQGNGFAITAEFRPHAVGRAFSVAFAI